MRTPLFPADRVRVAVALATLALSASGCGGDDDATPHDTTAVPLSVPDDAASGIDDHGATVNSGGIPLATIPGEIGEIGEIDGIGDLAAAVASGELTDAISALGIFTKADTIATTLGGEAHHVDDTTARIVLPGDVASDSLVACLVVNAIVDASDTIVLVYPNGETDCSD